MRLPVSYKKLPLCIRLRDRINHRRGEKWQEDTKRGLLPFKIVACDEPLVARSGLLLPYEIAKALKLPKVIDKELPKPMLFSSE